MALTAKQAVLVTLALEMYDTTARFSDKIAAVFPLTDIDTAKLGWLNRLPGFRTWVDERMVSGISDKEYLVKAAKYEETIGIKSEDWRWGRLYNAEALMRTIGADAAKFPDDLLIDVVNNGESLKTYDDKALFSATHPSGAGANNSNIITGTGVTIDKLGDDWDTACTRMQGFIVGATGNTDTRKLDVKPNAVLCPPGLERKFKTLFSAEQIDTSTNVYKGEIPLENIFASSKLSDANDWFAIYIGNPGVKPFAMVTVDSTDSGEPGSRVIASKGGFSISYLGPESEHTFWTDDVIIGAKLFVKLAPFAWFYICKIKNA